MNKKFNQSPVRTFGINSMFEVFLSCFLLFISSRESSCCGEMVMLAAETQMRCKKKKSLRKKSRRGTSRVFVASITQVVCGSLYLFMFKLEFQWDLH